MQISTLIAPPRLTVIVEGRMDNNTAGEFDNALRNAMLNQDIKEVILDCAGLAYVSSMGLRSLLTLQKTLDQKKVSLIFRNVGTDIMEIFDMTGFSRFLHIE